MLTRRPFQSLTIREATKTAASAARTRRGSNGMVEGGGDKTRFESWKKGYQSSTSHYIPTQLSAQLGGHRGRVNGQSGAVN